MGLENLIPTMEIEASAQALVAASSIEAAPIHSIARERNINRPMAPVEALSLKNFPLRTHPPRLT
jgi:hypothetical protein